MKRTLILLLVLAWARGAAAQPAAEVKSPSLPREQSEAYVALVKADRARDKDSWREAVEGYQKALQIYQRLAETNPEWQPDIVQYRIAYCGNQINAITTKSGKTIEEILVLPAAGGESADAALREKFLTLQKENQYLHQRIRQLEEEEPAEPTPAPAPAAASEAADLLQAENQKLREEIDQMKVRAQNLETVDPEHHRQTVLDNDALKSQAAALQREAEELRQSLDTYRKEAAATAALQQQMEYWQQRVQELEGEVSSATETQAREVAALQEQAAQLSSEKAAVEQDREDRSAALASETARADEASSSLEQLRLELPKWQAMADESASEAERLKGENQGLDQQRTAQARELDQLRSATAKDAETLLKLESENKDLKNQLTARNSELKDLQKEVQELSWNQEELKSLRQDVEVRRKENEALEKEIAAYAHLREEKKNLENALAQLRKEQETSGGPAAASEDKKPRDQEAEEKWARQAEKLKSEKENLQSEIQQLRSALAQATAVESAPRPDAPATEDPLAAAMAREKSRDYAGAMQEYERAAALDPNSTAAAKGLGRCLLKLGEATRAIETFEKVVSADAADADARCLLGLAYCADLRFDQAVEVLKQAVSSDPRNANAHSALGAAWMGLGTLDSARRELEEAVRLNPSLGDAYFNLAQVLCFSSPPDLIKARAHYDRAVELGSARNPELEKALTGP